ncbi:ATP-dependent DNA helicase [Corynebacterium sp. TAE3-ERU2]|uniref:ATP-dependent DNA helicase n=1 Tax=Corynebacterium sp. TAE3-ERU2 TaxID=2849497 RepID=UPI001C464FBA|nr:ATP-dependent DNA helicase [Corynebacterium sp. TAE3-ERU2]MBV7302875.1 ATP-dependent helicase [Corynebacterium sp. TAE3-ERU2]
MNSTPQMAPPPNPTVTVTYPGPRDTPRRTWSAAVHELVHAELTGTVKLIGAANTGVSSALSDTVVGLINAGVDPAEIALITTAKETASYHRSELSSLLGGRAEGFASAGTLVRSIHSLAFAIVRAARQRDIGTSPRMITGAEQDAVIRELLDGHRERGGAYWPEEQHEALELVGFARGLRDFLLRAQERGLGAADLEQLGEDWDRPLWTAAGQFLREYHHTMALSGQDSLNASELLAEAHRLIVDDEQLAQQVARSARYLLVDDAQNLDPKAAGLIEALTPHTTLMVLGGNPEHSVFHFRGADPDFFLDYHAEHTIELTEPQVQARSQYVVAADARSHHDFIADRVRRAGLLDSVAWRDIAVIVRSSGEIGSLQRALLIAGVPVHVDNSAMVLKEQRVVSSLLIAARSLLSRISSTELSELILGPVGGADPVTYRRLLRGVRAAEKLHGGSRRAIEVLEDLLLPQAPGYTAPENAEIRDSLTERETQILQRTTEVLEAGRAAYERGESVEAVLWALWEATGLAQHLQAVSLRGGASGSQADQDLDAAMALFDTAGDYTERRPGASFSSFISYIDSLDVPSLTRERRGAKTDAVTILTAHSVVGMHFRLVIVAGVNEGAWPQLGETGTLFGQEELINHTDEDIDPGVYVTHTAEREAEERRLLSLACSRATEQLYIMAIDDTESEDGTTEPSRFLAATPVSMRVYSAETAAGTSEDAGAVRAIHPRMLSTSSVIAELRRTLENPHAPAADREHAAYHLARLAEAGVLGASPQEWWGMRAASTTEPLVRAGETIRLSPSAIEKSLDCPLNGTVAKFADSASGSPQITGTLVHAFAEAIDNGAEESVARELVEHAFTQQLDDAEWRKDAEIARFSTMLDKTVSWIHSANAATTLVGTERQAWVRVGHLTEGEHDVMISGRLDRIDRSGDSLRVVDYKSSAQAIAQKEAADHAQLSAYQVAVAHARLDAEGNLATRRPEDPELEREGAVLVYPGTSTKKITTREQARLDEEQLAAFEDTLMALAREKAQPRVRAQLNEKQCTYCTLKAVCPAQDQGRSIFNA